MSKIKMNDDNTKDLQVIISARTKLKYLSLLIHGSNMDFNLRWLLIDIINRVNQELNGESKYLIARNINEILDKVKELI